MELAATITTWVALAAGVATVCLGLATLCTRRIIVRRERNAGTLLWKPYGLAQILLGTFVLVETIVRVTGEPALVTLIASGFALVALMASVAAGFRSGALQRDAPGAHTARAVHASRNRATEDPAT
jgi:biotin carboxylase